MQLLLECLSNWPGVCIFNVIQVRWISCVAASLGVTSRVLEGEQGKRSEFSFILIKKKSQSPFSQLLYFTTTPTCIFCRPHVSPSKFKSNTECRKGDSAVDKGIWWLGRQLKTYRALSELIQWMHLSQFSHSIWILLINSVQHLVKYRQASRATLIVSLALIWCFLSTFLQNTPSLSRRIDKQHCFNHPIEVPTIRSAFPVGLLNALPIEQ